MRSQTINLLSERLGSDVLDALEEMMEEKIKQMGVLREEYREILSRLELLEQGYERLRDDIAWLKEEIREVRRELSHINSRIDSMIRWTVGTVSLFGVLITAVMMILKFFG